jgi:hypothetical protein
VWEWVEPFTATGLRKAPKWFRSNPRKPPPEVFSPEPTEPTPDHPMTHLPARGAALFAWVMNCRLPTPEEWEAAYKANKSRTTTPAWNLRDTGQSGPLAGFVYGSTGVFKPPLPLPGAALAQRDDGQVLFQTVNANVGEPFRHIIGNVAEFAFKLDAKEYKSLEGQKPAQMVTSIDAFGKAGKLFVVGGSALSDPALVPPETPQLLKGPDTPMGGVFPRNAFCDVGMRLAFDAGGAGAPAAPGNEAAPPAVPDEQPRELLAALKALVGDRGETALDLGG